MTEIIFKADKVHRDRYFTATHFSHPAKMGVPLQRWLIENYTKPGEVILDPMAGSGTVLIACTMGRHVICVELEEKFVKMQRDNWAKIQTIGSEMGYEMGTATILQGDARNLTGILADKVLFSPPFAESANVQQQGMVKRGYFKTKNGQLASGFLGKMEVPDNPNNISGLPYGNMDKIITSPPFQEAEIRRSGQEKSRANYAYGSKLKMQSEHPDNISRLAENFYGSIDAVISSPPYEQSLDRWVGDNRNRLMVDKGLHAMPKVDAVISSPPYEGSIAGNGIGCDGKDPESNKLPREYSKSLTNIGNLKSTSYLEAMLQVYRQCFTVLKDGGLIVLVVKPFIRNQKEVKLQEDTKIICAKAGFIFVEEHYRVLTSQSFWRTIYARKYPSAPKLDREYILVFQKS